MRLADETKADVLLFSETWLQEKAELPPKSGLGIVNRANRKDGTQRASGVMAHVCVGLPVKKHETKLWAKRPSSVPQLAARRRR